MNIYFAGIGGVGLGPLAEIARDAGHTVAGSDISPSLTTAELEKSGVVISADQSGAFMEQLHAQTPIDWVVYTAALPETHPELAMARHLGIAHITKRDELVAHIVQEKNLRLIAVAGTHGKTTTTGMLVWTLQQLGVPVSYSVGSTLSFGPAGAYTPGSEYFVYECDEFDRNFLHFSPYLSLITSVDYDHPDTYPTPAEYVSAFNQFIRQSQQVLLWARDVATGLKVPAAAAWALNDSEVLELSLPGAHNRANATLVFKVLEYLRLTTTGDVTKILEGFPGTTRRFEKLGENLYTDYGHHPAEITATLQLASELSERIVLVYQPHQNTRQYQIRNEYGDCMMPAETVYWLPTYLTREDPSLPVLAPQELTQSVRTREPMRYAELNDELWQHITEARNDGKLVLCMGAGTIDGWVRTQLTK